MPLFSVLSASVLGVLSSPDTSGLLASLEGCWETERGTREVWTRGAPDLFFGFNVVRRDGRTVFFEDLRIEETGEGWQLVASPRGAPPTLFALSEISESGAAFTNPEHDFPQRIAYRWGDGKLIAHAELLDGENRQTWRYTSCAAQTAD